MEGMEPSQGLTSAYESSTFGKEASFELDKPVGSASISPCGRDVVLASRQGLHIIDLDTPWAPPRHLPHHTPWEVADVQWSPFAARDYWVVSTSNQKALVWNLQLGNAKSSVEHVLHAHARAITDINFSAHHPDILATCAVDSFVHCWDLRHPARPAMTFCDWFAGATQVKWNRQDSHVIASSHDKFLRIWDDRKGAYPLRSIEAHATKIYGVDWDRTETNKLVTCSLDKTIKFWDFNKEEDAPERDLHVSFPVWRARYTPFGFGILAMPQRGDYDLHLYDRRKDGFEDQEHKTTAVHKFGGHNDHVKEFLWRPRGSITEGTDEREFQLVSWGTDRVLRLHQVDGDVLGTVGYEKGVKRNFNVTRKNAVYKTFREDPATTTAENASTSLSEGSSKLGMRSALSVGMSKVSIPFIGGYGTGGFMSPVIGLKSPARRDMDPIAWMRGVKIGKRETSPDMHQSVSSIVSPSLRLDPTWDGFDSLGEEITYVGDKFRKVKFDTVWLLNQSSVKHWTDDEKIDVQRRYVVVSLSGPWGPSNDAVYVRTRIDFPVAYPDSATPSISLEKVASISDDTVNKMDSDLVFITASFASRQRSSLDAILRYLLGEQTLEDSLLWLKKRESVDLDSTRDLDLSSSDEEDEVPGNYVESQGDGMENSDPMVAISNARYNVPLPKACGALWAGNGLLICFFPSKPEKESSLLEMSLKTSDRSSRTRRTMFEGFGRLQNMSSRQKRHASTLETIESGDSDFDESATSSSASSSRSEDIGLPQHHFMPSMAFRSDMHEGPRGVTLDGSQRSSSDSRLRKSSTSTANMFVSIHDFRDLLPAKQRLAEDYTIGDGSLGSAQNEKIAKENGSLDSADVWSFVALLLQDKVPLELIRHPREEGSIVTVARRALSELRDQDSAIDLSFDDPEEQTSPLMPASVKWGNHPFGRRWFVQSLFRYYEHLADIQMLAMLSCAFSEPRKLPRSPGEDKHLSSPNSSATSLEALYWRWNVQNDYYPSEEVAKAQLQPVSPRLSVHVDYQNMHSEPHSSTSSTGAPMSDLSASNTPPSFYKPLRASLERRESQATSLSTSPEHLRHTYRSSSNLSALAASFSLPRPFSFSTSAASSPPNAHPRKRLSPEDSYHSTPSSTVTRNPAFLGRSSTMTEDPRAGLTLSISGNNENVPPTPKKLGFAIKLKNQDQFHNEGHANVALLNLSEEWRYCAYREAYAHLLYIWGMPIARTEILKYNHLLAAGPAPSYASHQDTASLLAIGKATSDPEAANLGFRDCCGSCSSTLPPKSTNRRCQSCSTKQPPPTCRFCATIIRGASSPCLKCGHAFHTSCRNLLPLTSADVPYECSSGCGCICTDQTVVAIHVPELTTKNSIEVSPAITIIGDAGVNEQEQLGWRETSEWEDVAYQSLVSNLVPRQEVRSKGSQIWRGRIGRMGSM